MFTYVATTAKNVYVCTALKLTYCYNFFLSVYIFGQDIKYYNLLIYFYSMCIFHFA